MRRLHEGLLLLLSMCGITSALTCTEVPGTLTQIDASNGQVFGVNNSTGGIYTLYGNTWTQLPGALSHVTVGLYGIWGVKSDHSIYRLVDGNWRQMSGVKSSSYHQDRLKQIDAGGSHSVVGVTTYNDVYCLEKSLAIAADGNSLLTWISFEGKYKYYSCGPLGCWGVKSDDKVFFQEYSTSYSSCGISRSHIKVPGALSMIEVGTEGDVYGVNRDGYIYRRAGITAANPTGTAWVHLSNDLGRIKHVSYDLGLLWVLTTEGKIFNCKVSALDCEQVPRALTQIDASNGQPFGVDSAGNIYTEYGNTWTLLSGAMTHVTTGPSGIWGVNSNHAIYKFIGGNWTLVSGLLKQIDAGGSQFIVGVNMNDDIYCLPKSSAIVADSGLTLPWIHIEGKLKYYSCGPLGCWGVNSADAIYYRHGVTPDSCAGSRWQNVPGAFSMIEVGTEGDVFGVNSNGNIFRRKGITKSNPIGTYWAQVEKKLGKAKHVSYDLDQLWVVTYEGNVFKCKV
ncbi:uncharacterized protein LOC129341749 [Eublepharis macularius]|uniref:Uncharacterized protein LOC129341749 n=1 Tax=Eublepharis macularius TaxID=481883 RepID=A0AA97KA94_EUBMA|nr:uncharacterized protein LOC129341749 [Eublepharis macularius]